MTPRRRLSRSKRCISGSTASHFLRIFRRFLNSRGSMPPTRVAVLLCFSFLFGPPMSRASGSGALTCAWRKSASALRAAMASSDGGRYSLRSRSRVASSKPTSLSARPLSFSGGNDLMSASRHTAKNSFCASLCCDVPRPSTPLSSPSSGSRAVARRYAARRAKLLARRGAASAAASAFTASQKQSCIVKACCRFASQSRPASCA
mmetsp:Transcript_375/g.949  ORF Transcript_375/g.949 Transcript_375/m.949 type:complete len:205 (+) Transcript_375:83-697(+)